MSIPSILRLVLIVPVLLLSSGCEKKKPESLEEWMEQKLDYKAPKPMSLSARRAAVEKLTAELKETTSREGMLAKLKEIESLTSVGIAVARGGLEQSGINRVEYTHYNQHLLFFKGAEMNAQLYVAGKTK